MKLTPEDCLPQDAELAALVGRAWIPGDHAGPSPVIIRDSAVLDISDHFPTVSELLNADNIVGVYRYTGNPDDDGYLSDQASANAINAQNDPAAFRYLYSLDKYIRLEYIIREK